MWWSLVFENVTNVYTNWFYIYGGHEFLNDDHTHTLAHTHNVNVGFCLCQKEKNWHSKKLLVDQSKKKTKWKRLAHWVVNVYFNWKKNDSV